MNCIARMKSKVTFIFFRCTTQKKKISQVVNTQRILASIQQREEDREKTQFSSSQTELDYGSPPMYYFSIGFRFCFLMNDCLFSMDKYKYVRMRFCMMCAYVYVYDRICHYVCIQCTNAKATSLLRSLEICILSHFGSLSIKAEY